MATRFGVDVGGTFTDLVLYDDESGEVRTAKVPTTSGSPEDGVLRALGEGAPAGLVGSAGYFLHGTTVGINVLLERRGARLGLLCTHGFRDVLELRRADRDDPYDLFWTPPPALVPRHLRLPVRERVNAAGAVLVPLVDEDVAAAARAFDEAGIECVAVAFLNAYANPEHELRAGELLAAAGYGGEISLSHRVSGEYREYERTTTTVVDAYVRPSMSGYLRRLEDGLSGAGFAGSTLVMRSGGGAMTFEDAERRPVETIISGPVAGAEGAAELARRFGWDDVIAMDVGGTSFDTCMVRGGRPQLMYEGRVVGLPLQIPWIDVRSIGAGGGSIAHVDAGGLLKVGPRSAGADPGPACYARGGTEPTVTDAAHVLGMLGAGRLAAGIVLDRDRAISALESLTGPLGLAVDDVSRGVITIAAAGMADAIREITVEQGHDPRRARLVAFGGAGPLFACVIARELGVREIVVPPHAGNFSAWGLLGADLTHTSARTRIVRLGPGSVPAVNDVLAELFAELTERANGAGGGEREVALDLRYVGQEHSLTVPVAAPGGSIRLDADELHDTFTREYRRIFDNALEGDVEIVSVRATLRTPLPRRDERAVEADDAPGVDEVDAYSFARGERLPFRVVTRGDLDLGETLAGPAIVLEATATTYVDEGFTAFRGEGGLLFLTDEGGVDGD